MYMVEKCVEKRAVNRVAFGMILHAKTEGIVTQTNLLNDIIAEMLGLDIETIAQLGDGLVVRAVNPWDADLRRR